VHNIVNFKVKYFIGNLIYRCIYTIKILKILCYVIMSRFFIKKPTVQIRIYVYIKCVVKCFFFFFNEILRANVIMRRVKGIDIEIDGIMLSSVFACIIT